MDIVILIGIYFFTLMKVVEEDMVRNCSRDDLDLILGNMSFVTLALITGTRYQYAVLIVMLLNFQKTTSRLNWNHELYSFYSAAALLAMQSVVIPTAIPTVRPSVCPSHAGTLSRRMNIESRGLHCEVAKTP